MSGPLASLKILDFSTLLPGPFASLMLADMGAQVLRVEPLGRPDLVRLLPPHVNGTSASHAYLNRNKDSIGLDLKQPHARDIVLRLLGEYDILIEQFRPGVMARLGLGYEQLRERHPGLIYVSVTGYGQTGPYRDRAGHDINYMALAGLSSYSGRQASGPAPLGMQVADIAGGSLHAVAGLLAAVIHRHQTGEGQQVDISMTDCVRTLNAMQGAACLATGEQPELESTLLNGASHYDVYQTRDGRWMAVGSLEPQFSTLLFEVLGCPELSAAALSQCPADRQALKHSLREAFAEQDYAYWCERFAAVDACVEPVLTLPEALAHPLLQARGMLQRVDNIPQLSCPIRFGSGLPAARHSGKTLGADTHRILAELGVSTAEIDALAAAGVVG